MIFVCTVLIHWGRQTKPLRKCYWSRCGRLFSLLNSHMPVYSLWDKRKRKKNDLGCFFSGTSHCLREKGGRMRQNELDSSSVFFHDSSPSTDYICQQFLCLWFKCRAPGNLFYVFPIKEHQSDSDLFKLAQILKQVLFSTCHMSYLVKEIWVINFRISRSYYTVKFKEVKIRIQAEGSRIWE